MKKKQITIVHMTTIPHSLYVFFEGQFRFMKEAGFNVVAISSPGEWLDAFSKREGIQVIGLEMTRKITPFKDIVAFLRLCRLLLSIRPDIVHVHTPKAGLLGTLAAWMVMVPVRIYHIHGFPFITASGFKAKILKTTEIVACSLASQVLCVSNSLMKYAIENNVCSDKKIKTLLEGTINGINTKTKFNPEKFSDKEKIGIRKSFKINQNNLVLGFVGRISRDKGILELYKAWGLIRKEFENVVLLIVGPMDSNQDKRTSEIVTMMYKDKRIHLPGMIEDIAPVYAVIDILVFPTYREGFGLAAIEASAMNVPVVASNIPGCVDAVVNGITGTLVPTYDVPALYEAIRNYLRDPQLRKEHGKAGRERVISSFSQEKMWAALRNEYDSLLLLRGMGK